MRFRKLIIMTSIALVCTPQALAAEEESAVERPTRSSCYPGASPSNPASAFAHRGPLKLGLAEGNPGFLRHACVRTQAGVASNIRTSNGAMVTGLGFQWKARPHQSFGIIIPVQYDTEDFGPGNVSLTYHHQLALPGPATRITALAARLIAPTSLSQSKAGVEIGVAASQAFGKLLEPHAYVGVGGLYSLWNEEEESGLLVAGELIAGTQIYPFGEWLSSVIDLRIGIDSDNLRIVPSAGLRIQSGTYGIELGIGYDPTNRGDVVAVGSLQWFP